MRKLLAALVAVLFSTSAFAAGLPLMPSSPTFSEPSQIVGTMNSLIQQFNGAAGYTTATPIIGLGAYCTNTAGATPQTCNGQRGAVNFSSLAGPLATGTVSTVVVNNSAITASSVCTAQWITAFTAGSGVTVATAVPTAGVLTVISVNAGTTTNAVTTGTLGFNCVN